MIFITKNRLAICVTAAAALHGAILFLPIAKHNKPQQNVRPLSVTLKPAPTRQATIATEQLRAKLQAKNQDVTELPEPSSSVQPSEQDLVERDSESKSPQHGTRREPFLQSDIAAQAIRLLSNSKPKFRSFSKSDYLPKPEAPGIKRPSAIPQLVALGSGSTSRSANGQTTEFIRNSSGDDMCWQQRGIPGETERWYRVPLALCGHLESP